MFKKYYSFQNKIVDVLFLKFNIIAERNTDVTEMDLDVLSQVSYKYDRLRYLCGLFTRIHLISL